MEAPLKYLLLLAVVFNGIFFDFFGLHFNLERIIVTALFVPIVATAYSYMIRSKPAAASACQGGWLYALWGFSLLISTALSNDPRAHLDGYVISVEPIIVYFYFSSGSRNGVIIERSVEIILWYLSVCGLALYFIWTVAAPSWLAFGINDVRLRLTLIEANIFGSTTSFFLILHFPYFKKSLRHYVLYALTLAAIACSFSRAPYIGLVAGVLVYLFAVGFFTPRRVIICGLFVLPLCILFALIFSAQLNDIYMRFLDRPDSIAVREIIYEAAWQRFLAHPIFGNGPLDFALSAQYIMPEIYSNSIRDVWISQMFLAIAHDSGLVGLTIYVAFLVGLLWHGFRLAVLRHSRRHAAYLAGFVSLLIASQSTTLHLTVIFGLAAGLLGSAGPVTEDDQFAHYKKRHAFALLRARRNARRLPATRGFVKRAFG